MKITNEDIERIINDNINEEVFELGEIASLLEDKKLINKFDRDKDRITLKPTYEVSFTQLAYDIYENGGWLKYMKRLHVEKQLEDLKKKLEIEKLKFDVKNSKRIYNTYWWTFIFSIISLIYVVLKIIQSIFPNFLNSLK